MIRLLDVAKIDESDNIIQGRYSGGVALLWRSELSKHIKQINWMQIGV